MYLVKVLGYFVVRRWLEQDIWVAVTRKCRGIRVRRLAERLGGDDGSCKRCGSVEILEKCPSQSGDWYGCIYGDALECWYVFAAVRICAEVCSGCVSEQDEGERRGMSGFGAISFMLVY